MNKERLGGSYAGDETEKPAWKVERERDLARKRKIGEVVMGVAAAAVVSAVLMHGVKTSEIMNDEERAKNVTKIEVEGVVLSDGANVRTEPFVGKDEPNQLASIDTVGKSAFVNYNGEAYCFNNKSDANGGWVGFDAARLSDKLLEEGCISEAEADLLESDVKKGDGIIWINDKNVMVLGADSTLADEPSWAN